MKKLVILALLLVACSPKKDLAKKNTLVKLGVAAQPVSVPPFSESTTTYSNEFCTATPKVQSYETRIMVVVDNSGSNYEYVDDPGSDNLGTRRFGALQRYLENLEKVNGANIDQYKFSLVVFNDPRTLGPSAITPGDIGYMDHGYNPSHPEKSSFMDKKSFTDIVNVVASRAKNDVLGQGYRKATGAATDYTLALQEMNAIIKHEMDLLEAQYQKSPTDFKKPFITIAFITDGQPIDASGNPITYDKKILPELKNLQTMINDEHKDLTVGFQLHTVAYASSANVLNQINPGICTKSSIPLNEIHNCPIPLLKTIAKQGGGDFYEVYNNEEIPYEKFSIPSFSQTSQLDNFFFINRSLLWSDQGKIEISPLNDGLSLSEISQTCSAQNLFIDPGLNTCSFPSTDILAPVVQRQLGSSIAVNNALANCQIQGITSTDTDGDGLNDCEEIALGSSLDNPDSNGDSIPDGLALRLKLPFRSGEATAANSDSDSDGVKNINEILDNTPIYYDNHSIKELQPQHITLTPVSQKDGISCYKINIQNVIFKNSTDVLELIVFESPNINTNGGPKMKARSILNCVGDFTGKYEQGEVCSVH